MAITLELSATDVPFAITDVTRKRPNGLTHATSTSHV